MRKDTPKQRAGKAAGLTAAEAELTPAEAEYIVETLMCSSQTLAEDENSITALLTISHICETGSMTARFSLALALARVAAPHLKSYDEYVKGLTDAYLARMRARLAGKQ